jgi:hypothetical protein
MKTIRSILGALLFVGLFTSAATAGTAGRTFVSSLGADTNPCSLTAPCRTFAQAISQTSEGGEVVVLNSAGYGPFTINQSVAITAPDGIYAGITQGSDSLDGIVIAAGPTQVVTLKGLTIIGPGPGVSDSTGVLFSSGAVLHVEGCEVRGFQDGILIEAANSQSFIKDTVVKDGGDGGIVFFAGSPGSMFGSMERVTATNNNGSAGISANVDVAGAVVDVAIRDSTISGNASGGVSVAQGSGGTAAIDIESCLIANGGTALNASGGAGATMSISNCMMSGNRFRFDIQNGAAVFSRVNNTFHDLSESVTGSLTPLAAQ